jgi:hypothetical protein
MITVTKRPLTISVTKKNMTITVVQYRRTLTVTAAEVRSTLLTGLSLVTGTAITAADTILSAFGKVQKQITDNLSTLTSHIGNTNNPHVVTADQVGLGNVDNTADIDKPISTDQQTALNAKANSSHTHPISDVTSLQASLDAKQNSLGFTPENAANKNQLDGYAGLDSSGKVPASLLPGYVDDVLEYSELATFPVTGETGKMYIAIDTGKSYRWTGSVYVEISASPGSTDAVTEGSTNLYFTTDRVLATLLTGVSFAVGTAIVAGDTILAAMGKLQKQITDLNTNKVSTTRTVNGHALTSDVVVTKGDVGLGNAENTADINKNVNSALTLTNSRTIDGQGFNGSTNITVIAPGTVAATSKTTPVDADVMPIADSEASNILKKLTWANLKATLKIYLDTLYLPKVANSYPWRLLPLVAGRRYVSNTITFQFADSGAIVAGRHYAMPYYNREAHTYTKAGLVVNTAVNGAKGRIAIYTDNAGVVNGGSLVYDSGDLTMSGVLEQALDKTLSFGLAADTWYWIDVVFDTVVSVQVTTSNTIDYAYMGKPDSLVSGVNGIRAYGNMTSNVGYGAPAATAPAYTPTQSVCPVVQLLA